MNGEYVMIWKEAVTTIPVQVYTHARARARAHTRVYPKVSGLSHKEIYAYLWPYSFRSNIKG
jgi:hypothetical protein